MRQSSTYRRPAVAALLSLAAAVCAPAYGQVATSQPADQPVTGTLADKREYQLLLPPEARSSQGLPLVVYLHPSGPRLIEEFRRDYWPLLRGRKCIVAIPLSAGEKMWLSDEDKYVQDVIADVQKQYKTDPKKVILLGLSGGGQLALFLAGHYPQDYRAIIAVSTNPVAIRGDEEIWFYPDRKTLKKCPYFVINPIGEGASLKYWRQLAAKLSPEGASISIIPALAGDVKGHFVSPPKELGPWLDDVLAGKHPAPLPDPQKLAVAKMFQKVVEELPGDIKKDAPAGGQKTVKQVGEQMLSLMMPDDCERSKREEIVDAAGRAIRQIRIEHKTDPVYVRCEARQAGIGMKAAIAADESETIQRGMLYQVYTTGKVAAGGRNWEYRIGSITFPDQRRKSWQSTLFVNAWSPLQADAKEWLEVTLLDETQEPRASQMAAIFKAVVASAKFEKAPATQPEKKN